MSVFVPVSSDFLYKVRAKTYEVNEGGISSEKFRLIKAWVDELLISVSVEKRKVMIYLIRNPRGSLWLWERFPYF